MFGNLRGVFLGVWLVLGGAAGALGAVGDARFLELCQSGTVKEVQAALKGGAPMDARN